MESPGLNTEAIWAALGEPLRRFILRRVSDPADAEDILQDVFVKIHTRIGTLEDEAHLYAWVYQIARNAVTDHYRAAKPHDELSETIALTPKDDDEIERIMLRSMREFVAALPDGYRRAVEMEAAGIPQKDIAAALGISLSGAKSRVQRGRAMVKDLLETCCEYQFDRYGKVIDYRRRNAACDAC